MSGYTQQRKRVYEFATRDARTWDWKELLDFCRAVAERDFDYPAEYMVTEHALDLRAMIDQAKTRLKEKLGKL